MMPVPQQNLLEIANVASKILRKKFGRGPVSCQAFANRNYLVFYLKGFLSPMETVLLEHGNVDSLETSRQIVMASVANQLQGVLELEFGQNMLDFYHDWNYERNTGMMAAAFEHALADDTASFPEREALVEEVERISRLVEKIPDKTEAFLISPKVFLVRREGLLVPIEKALIAKGYQQILLMTKDDLEKSHYHLDTRFEKIFNQPVADIFVDWNFAADDSLLCIVLK